MPFLRIAGHPRLPSAVGAGQIAWKRNFRHARIVLVEMGVIPRVSKQSKGDSGPSSR